MSFGNSFTNCKSKTGSLLFMSNKGDKQIFFIFFRNTGATVLNGYKNMIIFVFQRTGNGTWLEIASAAFLRRFKISCFNFILSAFSVGSIRFHIQRNGNILGFHRWSQRIQWFHGKFVRKSNSCARRVFELLNSENSSNRYFRKSMFSMTLSQ